MRMTLWPLTAAPRGTSRRRRRAGTPALDALARESVVVTHAVSGHPVCCPYRASLLTGQYDVKHGVIINDVPIAPGAVGLGDAFKAAGYDNAYVGKWHAHGSPEGKLSHGR